MLLLVFVHHLLELLLGLPEGQLQLKPAIISIHQAALHLLLLTSQPLPAARLVG